MQKLTLQTPLFTVEISAEDERDIFKKAAFWLSLPPACPVCGAAVVLDYRTPKTFKYYELKCTGTPAHKTNLGQPQDLSTLYYDKSKPWTDSMHQDHERGPEHQAAPPTEQRRQPTPIAALSSTAPADPMPHVQYGEKADIGARKNVLIKLIKDAQDTGLRTGLIPADVAGMSEGDLAANTTKVAAALDAARTAKGAAAGQSIAGDGFSDKSNF